MARITLRQLLDHAAEHGYGVPAFNINNMEQGLAILEAAQKTDSPGHHPGQPRRAPVRQRSDAGEDDRRPGRHLPVDPDLHAPGPRQRRSHLRHRHPARLHQRDDGRLAGGRRQDAGQLRLQRQGDPRRDEDGPLGRRVGGGRTRGTGIAGDGHGREGGWPRLRGQARPHPAPHRP